MNRFLPFEWILAIRFLREGRSQTLLTIIGAAVGVSVIVFMSSLLTGVQSNIFARILSTQAHIVVSPPKDETRTLRPDAEEIAIIQRPTQRLRSIDQWQSVVALVKQRPEVVAVSATVSGSASFVRGDTVKSVSVTGIIPADFFRIVPLSDKLVLGSAELIPGNCLIGTELATDLGVGIGEKLRLRAGNATSGAADETLVVGGIFDLGDRGANERNVYVTLRSAQSLFDVPGGVTTISINLTDPYQAETVSAQLVNELGLTVDSWIVTFAQLFTALTTQTIAFGVIEFFVALAVSLGIASVLVVSVVQRSREIGILRAMGCSRGQVMRVFILQGAVIGLVGSLAGSILGAAFIQLWRLFARDSSGTEYFPLTMPLSLLLLTGTVATLTGLVTAVLPAISAARLNPVDAIRG